MRDFRKTKGGRNLILFANKLTEHRKFTEFFFFPKIARFFVMPVCLKLGIFSKTIIIYTNP